MNLIMNQEAKEKLFDLLRSDQVAEMAAFIVPYWHYPVWLEFVLPEIRSLEMFDVLNISNVDKAFGRHTDWSGLSDHMIRSLVARGTDVEWSMSQKPAFLIQRLLSLGVNPNKVDVNALPYMCFADPSTWELFMIAGAHLPSFKDFRKTFGPKSDYGRWSALFALGVMPEASDGWDNALCNEFYRWRALQLRAVAVWRAALDWTTCTFMLRGDDIIVGPQPAAPLHPNRKRF